MLTVREVAERLKLSPGAVYKAVDRGELECHRFGAAIRISEEQLARYLDQTRSGPPERAGRRSFRHLDL